MNKDNSSSYTERPMLEVTVQNTISLWSSSISKVLTKLNIPLSTLYLFTVEMDETFCHKLRLSYKNFRRDFIHIFFNSSSSLHAYQSVTNNKQDVCCCKPHSKIWETRSLHCNQHLQNRLRIWQPPRTAACIKKIQLVVFKIDSLFVPSRTSTSYLCFVVTYTGTNYSKK